jgi:hypothetical protein
VVGDLVENNSENLPSMEDISYLLFKQCVLDIKHIAEETGVSLDQNAILVFFEERAKNPVTLDLLTKLMTAGYNAEQVLVEVKNSYEELLKVNAELEEKQKQYNEVLLAINEHKLEIKKLQNTLPESKDRIGVLNKKTNVINAGEKAEDFLSSAIGDKYILKLRSERKLDVQGTNGAIYRITIDGKVSKYIRERSGYVSVWCGSVRDTNMPMDDCIASIITHIISDSDQFDRDKGCGQIRIRDG